MRLITIRTVWSVGVIWIGSVFALMSLGWLGGTAAEAQIIPDETLGAEGSRVDRDIQVRGERGDRIEGGASRGSSLFHSFLEFNVTDGQRVYFANPSGIENILGRVTGADVSDIMGTLGVDGGANLFLLNPNGFIFGENAQLDISGSFVTSTADRFAFLDGTDFSAANPQAPPLLTVNVPIGLQYGTGRGAIANAATLTVGQDLTLLGETLDLQGQLQAGGDLTLYAEDTLRIRDSINRPFIAAAGGDLLVQGNQAVNIFALNHSGSGLFAGGQMTLRSAQTIGGDAHFSAGSFQVEQLDGTPGNLFSPYDPIILSIGNVSLGDYTGASLHILAGGSVVLGNVIITAPDTIGDSINPSNSTLFNGINTIASLANLTLSDGTPIAINGNAVGTLDVRAGIDWIALGGLPIPDPFVAGAIPAPAIAPPTNSSITTGSIDLFNQNNGMVLLTNQFSPNLTLPSGTISTQSIRTNTDIPLANAGSITLDSRSDVNTGDLFPLASVGAGNSGNGGNVTLLGGGNVTVNGSIIAGSDTASGTSANGGTIRFVSGGDITVTDGITSRSNVFGNGTSGNAGTISLISGGNVNLLTLSTRSEVDGNGDAGRGGNISVNAAGTLQLGSAFVDTENISLFSYSRVDGTGAASNAGTVSLTSGGDMTIPSSLRSFSQANQGTAGSGGEISLRSGGAIILGDGSPADASTLESFARSENGITGNGGNITIVGNSTVRTNNTNSESSSARAGNVSIASLADSVFVNGDVTAESNNTTGASGFSTIRIEAQRGSVLVDAADVTTTNRSTTLSGTIFIDARDLVSITNNSTISSDGNLGQVFVGYRFIGDTALPTQVLIDNSDLSTSNDVIGGVRQAGSIQVGAAETLQITNGSALASDTTGVGAGGSISLFSPTGNVLLDQGSTLRVETGGAGRGGNVTLDGGSVTLSDDAAIRANSFSTGAGGAIRLRADNGVAVNRSSLAAQVYGSGNGGSITVTGEDITVDDQSFITAETLAQGNGGAISLQATDDVTIDQNSSVTVRTADTGAGGSINLQGESITLDNGAVINAETLSSGAGGAIVLEAIDDPTIAGDGAIAIRNFSTISAVTEGSGDAGNITVNGGSIALGEFSTIEAGIGTTSGLATGSAGDIRLTTTEALVINDGTIDNQVEGTNPLSDPAQLTLRGASVSLTNTQINAGTTGAIDAGNVLVEATDGAVTLTNSAISSQVQPDSAGDGGDVTLRGEAVALIQSTINAENGGSGTGGSVAIETTSGGNVTLTDFSIVSTSLRPEATGTGGNITINAGSATLNQGARLEAETLSERGSTAVGGSIQLTTTGLTEVDDATISTTVEQNATGAGGNVTLTAGNVRLSNGARLAAETLGSGRAGSIDVEAVNGGTIDVNNSTIATGTREQASGAGGDITLAAGTVNLANSAQVDATTSGVSDGGSIQITADAVNLTDRAALDTSTTGIGNGGDIVLNAAEVALSDRAQINAQTFGQGNGGDITVNATDGNVSLIGGSNISTAIELGSEGNGGNIRIDARNVQLRGGSRLETLTRGEGAAGDIQVNADRLVSVSGANAFGLTSGILTSSEIATSGQGGNITIGQPGNSSTVNLSQGGVFSALTRSNADGGDITVNARIVNLTSGGQLTTSAFNSGNAGQITVNASEEISIEESNPNFIDFGSTGNVGTGSGNVTEVEANDSIATAQTVPLTLFSLQPNANVELSTNIPYVSIEGAGNDSVDYYAFNVTTPGSRGIFDIDNAFDSIGNTVDTEIFLFDNSGNLLDSNDDSSTLSGGGGSGNGGGNLHSYLSYTFGAPGRYVLGVSRYDSDVVNSAITGRTIEAGDTYNLQASLDNRNTNPNQSAQSGLFARTEGAGAAGSVALNTPELNVLNQAQVSVETVSQGNAGDITVRPYGNETTLEINLNGRGAISASTSGSGVGGDIRLVAPQSIEVSGNGTISAETSGAAAAGNLSIETQTLTIQGNARLSTSTISTNPAAIGGDITVNVDEINVSGANSGLFAETTGAADAGNLRLQPYRQGENLTVNFAGGAEISASTSGSGTGGTLVVSAPQTVTIQGDGILSAQATDSGNAGQFTINTNDLTVADGATVSASSNSSVGGNIRLENLETLQVTDARISASTQTGRAGTLRVGATERVELSGTGGLFVQATRGGEAGSLFVTTPELALTNRAEISVSSTEDGAAGLLQITAAEVMLDNATITATTEAATTEAAEVGGNITLRSLDRLQLRNSSEISASTVDGTGGSLTVNLNQSPADLILLEGASQLSAQATGRGNAGDLRLNTRELRLTGRSQIIASTNSGSQGDIFLQGLDTLTIENSVISASTRSGVAGSLTVDGAEQVRLRGRGGLLVQATQGGNAGDLTLTTDQLLAEGGEISVSSTGDGSGGTLQITAAGIALENGARLLATTEAGEGGDIVLRNVRSLQLSDRSEISASTIDGNGGSVTVNDAGTAARSIRLSSGSRLSAQATRRGNGGDVILNTRQLALQGDAQISASTNSGQGGGDITLRNLNTLEVINSEISASTETGRAGTLDVEARDSVFLSGEGGLRVQANAGGRAGNLEVRTGILQIEDGAELSVSSRSGVAGNLFVDARSIRLNNGSIRAETGQGNGGNITLQGFTGLSLRNGSQISAEAFGTATGGNITIDAPDSFIIAVPVENSDIFADANAGNGGVIDITTRGIYGLEFRPERTPLSDITANSDTGQAGTVIIDTLGIDPSRGLAELPTSVVDASQQVAQGCSARGVATDDLGEFVVTGRGGLPPNPLEPTQSNAGLTGLVTLDDDVLADNSMPLPIADAPPLELPAIVEAQGWALDAQGRVMLVSETAIATTPASTNAVCLQSQAATQP